MQFPLSGDYWGLGDFFKALSGLGFCPCPPCPIHSHRLHPDLSKKQVFEKSVKHLLVLIAKGSWTTCPTSLDNSYGFLAILIEQKKCRTHLEISCKPKKSLIFNTQLEFYEDNSYQILYRQRLLYFIQLLEKNNYALYNLKCICIPSK